MSYPPVYLMSKGPEEPTPILNPNPPIPAVWVFFLAYCIGMVLITLLMIVMGIGLAFTPEPELEGKMEPMEAKFFSAFLVVAGAALSSLFALGIFSPKGKAKWILGIVLICLGFCNGCTLFPCIALLIFWIRSDGLHLYFRLK